MNKLPGTAQANIALTVIDTYLVELPRIQQNTEVEKGRLANEYRRDEQDHEVTLASIKQQKSANQNDLDLFRYTLESELQRHQDNNAVALAEHKMKATRDTAVSCLDAEKLKNDSQLKSYQGQIELKKGIESAKARISMREEDIQCQAARHQIEQQREADSFAFLQKEREIKLVHGLRVAEEERIDLDNKIKVSLQETGHQMSRQETVHLECLVSVMTQPGVSQEHKDFMMWAVQEYQRQSQQLITAAASTEANN